MSLASGYFRDDTIAAISTALGGAVSMVRVSGPQAMGALGALAKLTPPPLFERAKLTRTPLFLPNGQPLDDALVACFYNPQSFTGEDVVELHLHGGVFVAQRVMETLLASGVRQALAGEFSFRAVRNGKMGLFQAQAIADLIAAKNDQALSMAVEKLSGAHSKFLSDLATQIRELAALGELGIDFSDQDVEEVSLPALKKRALQALGILRQLQSSFDRGVKIQEGLRAVFAGLPNAGKSSFFNALLGEDRSIVSETAGTTRDIVREHLTLRGKTASITLRLEDTAGLRATENAVEKQGIERTHRAAREADLIFFLVDPTASIEEACQQFQSLGGWVVTEGKKALADITVGILTKADLLSSEALQNIQTKLGAFGISRWVTTSSVTGQGMSEAVESIVTFCEKRTHRQSGEILLTRLDHLAAVEKAIGELEQALHATEIDLFASDIRQALYSLSPLIGETATDDILGKIFSDFCIGK